MSDNLWSSNSTLAQQRGLFLWVGEQNWDTAHNNQTQPYPLLIPYQRSTMRPISQLHQKALKIYHVSTVIRTILIGTWTWTFLMVLNTTPTTPP